MGRPQTVSLSRSTPTTGSSLRRAADVVLSGLLLLIALPLLALVALLVRVSSHGPVLHREQGVGPDGRRVELLSFRTLIDGGGTEVHARLRAVVGGGDAYTPVGRLLARLRLDRLPRLLNVLRGETSLVG